MPDGVHVIAGTCTTEYDGGARASTQRGDVVAVCKPDNTVLVHDADGYQPVAWLTRPASLTVGPDRIEARDGDERLVVTVHESHGRARYPATPAGAPVGPCPACGGHLVRHSRAVACGGCGDSYPVPADAAVGEAEDCAACGLPTLTVERGAELTVCVDRDCESLDDRVREAFDRAWACPDCGGDLRVLRRGGLVLGCEAYPDCETNYSFPAGVLAGTCDCGLPAFETATGTRCLDTACAGG